MSAGRGRGMPQQQPQYNAMYQDIAQMSLQDPNIQLSNQLRQMLLTQESKNNHQAHNIMMNPPIMGPLGQQNPGQNMYMPDNNWMMGQGQPMQQVMPQGVTMSNMFNMSNQNNVRQQMGAGNGQYGQSFPQQQFRQPQYQPQQRMQQTPGSRTGPMGPIKPGVFEQPVGAQISQSPQSAQTGPVGQSLFKSGPSNDMSGDEFLQSLMKGADSPQSNNPAAAVASQGPPSNTSLSVSANEFVPCFRKPEKQIVLYTYESFKKKSKADDENAINDVKTKLVKLFNDPQDVAAIMEPSVNTVKSWTTSITTYHQIVEDIFEFSIDEVNHPNFYHIGSKVLGYFTLNIPAYGTPPLTFFDAIIHKCCREYDNCLREDLSLAQRQHRARHVALMIAELFNTIKEGDLRVFVFAEQIVHLCHLLTQCPTNSTVDAVAKIMLVCGRDLKDLVDDDRFGSIINSLSIIVDRMGASLDSKTVTMVESVVKLNKAGWPWDESQNNCSEGAGGDTDAPVANAVDWNEYATDDFDDQWLNDMLRFEEEDDFSDVEEDFKRFMLDAAKSKS